MSFKSEWMEMFGLHNSPLDDAVYLADIIEEYFGNKVSLVTPKIDTKNNYLWFSVSFVLYRTYQFTYDYEKGCYSIFSTHPDKSGICIHFSKENQQKFDNKNIDKHAIIENLRLLDIETRLRLPDKFLELFG